MALLPKISLSLENKCDKVDICEETGVYAAGNVGGWGAPNITMANAVTAKVYVYNSAGTSLLQTFTIKDGTTDLFPVSLLSPFQAFDGAAWNQTDGIFKIVYTVIDAVPTTYNNNEQYCLFTCNLQNCMEVLIGKMVTECDAEKLDEYKQILDQLEVLLYGIKTAFACKNFTRAETLLTNAATICTTFSGCDCGCDCGC